MELIGERLQSLWNPFRDWNTKAPLATILNGGFKASETLLGIETETQTQTQTQNTETELQSLWNPFRDWNKDADFFIYADPRFKASETLLGIETLICSHADLGAAKGRFKASETLLGIETKNLRFSPWAPRSFKASETLLGIETGKYLPSHLPSSISASKPLKPF